MSKEKPTSSYEAMTQEHKREKSAQTKPEQDNKADTKQADTEATPVTHETESQTHNPVHQKQLEDHIGQLEEALQKKEKEFKDLKLRNMADINNLQDRYSREMANTKTYAHQYFAKDILDIADALEQAEQSLEGSQKEGIQLIRDMLQKALTKHHIDTIDPTGEVYDHKHHEAMAMQANKDVKNNHIIQVVQKGYKIKDRLLRAARVIVAKND